MTNVLIAYFSASGVTKNLAEKIANDNDYDIFEIVPEEIYTPEDLDWTNKQSRSTIEMNDKSFRPPISESCDVGEYETVVIGFPVWWYTAPTIINTFIESVDLTGKKIKIFCTSGGSGVDKCVNDLKATYPELNFTKGIRFTGNVSNAKEWIEQDL
ncbi:MAG: flavodoxin [archaeon]|uniref:Flavodoxin-like protein n=1 Tax=Methanobrevibacter gottschalkii DSM 11977 TaxID=1122229 RepID=A0A3N5C0T8_9EURY|nr:MULTISPECIES: flavodoxin [Methanobrevibacter]MCQ2970045.1 flavodoxin [archaeon]OEC97998.1 flavodoxin [Methanobrevibacter sp. A27]RPF51735.1 flavodoxin-like protein [Methanobrevibacter gottschalkii DSM 11977]